VLVSHVLTVRGIAIRHLGVLGIWGVLIFFVHTSLVLLFSLERQTNDDPKTSKIVHTGRFLIRRVFRIYPASIIATLVACAFNLPLRNFVAGHFVGTVTDTRVFLSNLLLVQNLTHTESVLGPLWSLPYELQMYCMLPWLYWLTRKRSGGVVIAGWIATSIACVLVPASVLGVWDMAFFAPCFLAGVVAYRLSRTVTPTLPFYLWPLVILTAGSFYLHYRITHAAPTFGWLACLALGISVSFFRELPAVLHPPFKIIARYSYGIYLTHDFGLWLAFGHFSRLSTGIQWAVFVGVTIVSTVLLYHLVEHPMVRLGARLSGGSVAKHGLPPSNALRPRRARV
jgi:peptidoglycan/LPS O-acetylase OafA/YrhL